MAKRLERLCARAIELGVDAQIADAIEPMLRALARGERAYDDFHWGRRSEHGTIIHMAAVPPLVWELGPLVSVTYAAKKGSTNRGRVVHWEHPFDAPKPRLVSDEDGSQLWIVGGGYSVTERGIVG